MNTLDQPNQWAHILDAIDLEAPCGVDLQYDEKYDSIRRDRQPSGPELPTGVWDRDIKKIDYDSISSRCILLLESESKDIQVVGWLIESRVLSNDLAGAAQAVELLHALMLKYWDVIYPRAEDDDVELRLGPIRWIMREGKRWFAPNEPLIIKCPKEDSKSHADWMRLFVQFQGIEKLISDALGDGAPIFRDFLELLSIGLVPLQSGSELKLTDQTLKGMSHVVSRESAYEQLSEIAKFLARVEPHSPVPMVLDALVAWRGSSFEDLLLRLPSQGGSSVYDLLRLFRPDSLKR
jgi:hypothetical protein